uniref:P7 protein n=1 Tax=Tomato chlorosis virus TaxID=67754 RepID=A0A218MIZ1_9CLOS|nr:P7 protein [Tomato chlorosis virus]AXF74719.1 P7 protein [Tomato chlorosis virus]
MISIYFALIGLIFLVVFCFVLLSYFVFTVVKYFNKERGDGDDNSYISNVAPFGSNRFNQQPPIVR